MADERNEDLEEQSDARASVGDIFGVSAGKKKKKKKPKAEEAAPAEEPARAEAASKPAPPEAPEELEVPGDDEPTRVAAPSVKAAPEPDGSTETAAKAEKAEKPKKKKSTAAVDGVLLPGGPAPAVDPDDYLSPQDLGDYAPPRSKAVPILVSIIVVLVLVIVGGGLVATGQGDDLVALFKGELREKRIAEARMEEEQFHADQLARLELFGNLMINGSPQYSLIKLNGQVQYGETSAGWRELRVGTTPGIQDVKVKQTHVVEFSSPGFESHTVEVTEGKWQENSGGAGYMYSISPTLLPSSIQAKQEYDARMGEDEENEFYGKVTINTIPSGANVQFNNQPLLDEKGEELTTPVTFDRYWVKDEKTGKLEEKQVRVDTTFDVGHKIVLSLDYPNQCAEGVAAECGKADGCCAPGCNPGTDKDCQWPAYVTSLMRPMWTCNWVDGAPPTEVAKGKTIQHYCDYTFTLDLDFNSLKSYIVAREEEKQRVLQQLEDAKKAAKEAASEKAEAP